MLLDGVAKQMMPADGWHVVLAYRDLDGAVGIDIEKLIAWVLVDRTYRGGEVESEIQGVYIFEGDPVICNSNHLQVTCSYVLVGYFEHDELEKNREHFQKTAERRLNLSEQIRDRMVIEPKGESR